jgi:6-pyruvoyltetrahydropterin/6-carboxytetrahydropterin synthase
MKDKIRITKLFHFEMAHALYGYDGACKNIHGHSYQLSVTVIGEPSVAYNDPKLGMVMDFGDLKKIVMPIIDSLDHATLLNGSSPHNEAAMDNPLFQKLVLVDYQPTCENMLIDFSKRISKGLPSEIKLHHLKLIETPSSFAEWFADDNLNL